MTSIIGALSEKSTDLIIMQLLQRQLVELRNAPNNSGRTFSLSYDGWGYYDELQRNRTESRNVLMAMQYNDPELDLVVKDYFKPAINMTGFNLVRLDESGVRKAGLIDAHMEVAIRTSRFIVADLTHKNTGAYWEAGFAHGLGKPVIYTCRKKEFSEQRTHFDTNHHQTVVWNPEEPQSAAEELKDIIRATLPDEAILQDD